jgi:hypothetical protein
VQRVAKGPELLVLLKAAKQVNIGTHAELRRLRNQWRCEECSQEK